MSAIQWHFPCKWLFSAHLLLFFVLNRENYFNNITSVLHQIVSADRLKANPELVGSTSFQLFDKTVQALTDAHLMVILNNHVNKIYLNCNPIKLCKDHARNFRSGSFQFSFQHFHEWKMRLPLWNQFCTGLICNVVLHLYFTQTKTKISLIIDALRATFI